MTEDAIGAEGYRRGIETKFLKFNEKERRVNINLIFRWFVSVRKRRIEKFAVNIELNGLRWILRRVSRIQMRNILLLFHEIIIVYRWKNLIDSFFRGLIYFHWKIDKHTFIVKLLFLFLSIASIIYRNIRKISERTGNNYTAKLLKLI